MVVGDDGLSRDKHGIIDPFVAEQTTKIISRYYNTLNRIDTQDWTVKEIVDYMDVVHHLVTLTSHSITPHSRWQGYTLR